MTLSITKSNVTFVTREITCFVIANVVVLAISQKGRFVRIYMVFLLLTWPQKTGSFLNVVTGKMAVASSRDKVITAGATFIMKLRQKIRKLPSTSLKANNYLG